jgi:hypothetical protein
VQPTDNARERIGVVGPVRASIQIDGRAGRFRVSIEARTIETAVSSTAGEVIKGLSLAPGEDRDVATVRVESAKRPVDDGPK